MRFNFGENFTDGVTPVVPVASYFDATANDSNKSWVVPDGEMWELNWAHVILASTATVGNRVVCIDVLDEDGNILLDLPSAVVQAASATNHYAFFQGIFRESAFVLSSLQVPIPRSLMLKAGYTLKFYDRAAIAAAADDMTVSFQVNVYKGC
jgi:hypothetical protein